MTRLGFDATGVVVPIAYYADLFQRRSVAEGAEALDAATSGLLAEWARDAFGVSFQGPIEQALGQLSQAIGSRLGMLPTWLVERLVRVGAREAAEYLASPTTRSSIRTTVSKVIRAEAPRVVIAHSLGTVVTWEALQACPELNVELLLTIGSPLATPTAIFPKLVPHPELGHSKPPGVIRWVNVWHPGDLVAAMGPIRSAFPDVDEEFQIAVNQRECHRATSYLRSNEVASLVGTYLPVAST